MSNYSNGFKKNKPTIFPMGFRVGMTDDSLIIIDFADHLNNETVIIDSIALTEKKATQLVEALSEVLNPELTIGEYDDE